MSTVSTSKKRKAVDGEGLRPRGRSRNTSSGVSVVSGETSSSENNRKRKKIISPTFVPSEADEEEEKDVEMSEVEKSSPEIEEISELQSEKSDVDESATSMSRMTIEELEKLKKVEIAKEETRAEMAKEEVTKEKELQDEEERKKRSMEKKQARAIKNIAGGVHKLSKKQKNKEKVGKGTVVDKGKGKEMVIAVEPEETRLSDEEMVVFWKPLLPEERSEIWTKIPVDTPIAITTNHLSLVAEYLKTHRIKGEKIGEEIAKFARCKKSRGLIFVSTFGALGAGGAEDGAIEDAITFLTTEQKGKAIKITQPPQIHNKWKMVEVDSPETAQLLADTRHIRRSHPTEALVTFRALDPKPSLWKGFKVLRVPEEQTGLREIIGRWSSAAYRAPGTEIKLDIEKYKPRLGEIRQIPTVDVNILYQVNSIDEALKYRHVQSAQLSWQNDVGQWTSWPIKPPSTCVKCKGEGHTQAQCWWQFRSGNEQ